MFGCLVLRTHEYLYIHRKTRKAVTDRSKNCFVAYEAVIPLLLLFARPRAAALALVTKMQLRGDVPLLLLLAALAPTAADDAATASAIPRAAVTAGSATESAAHDNWRRLAQLNDVVYNVDNDYKLSYAGRKGSFTSGALSLVSFVPSLAAAPPASSPPSPPFPALPPLAPIPVGQTFIAGCTDPQASNFNPSANFQAPGSCFYAIYGCMQPDAKNYIPTANTPTQCIYEVIGCTAPLASNYGAPPVCATC